MSRCLPYPPPAYVRIPEAVAEAESTAKLQKERGKAEKKKEKRGDKKTLLPGESSKPSKHNHKRKRGDVSTAGKETKKVSKESVEQLERSGLTEEHGGPCFNQMVHDSPESSQDSSKRRKIVLPSPTQAKNGNVLRIKIKSNQDSPRVPEQPLVKPLGSGAYLLNKQDSVVQQHKKVNVKSTTAAQQRINVQSQVVQKRVVTEPPAKRQRRALPQPVLGVKQEIGPQFSGKAQVQELSGKAQVGSVGSLHAKKMERFDSPPSKLTQKVQVQLTPREIKLPSEPANVIQKVIGSAAILQPEVWFVQKTDSSLIKQDLLMPSCLVKDDEPCSSGRDAGTVTVQEARDARTVPVQETKLSRSDRKKSRKAEKKEKKFSDLFVTWNPLPLEMDTDQDWLLGSTRKSASVSNCRSDGSATFQSMEQQHSLQPRATFLPDLNIYQLPYVVPF